MPQSAMTLKKRLHKKLYDVVLYLKQSFNLKQEWTWPSWVQFGCCKSIIAGKAWNKESMLIIGL